MLKIVPDHAKQKEIIENHTSSKDALLEKTIHRIGSGVGGLEKLFTAYELVGLANYKNNIFLPHFEYNVGTSAVVKLPQMSISEIKKNHDSNEDSNDVKLKVDDKTAKGVFKNATNLFRYRNLLACGSTTLKDVVFPVEVKPISDQSFFEYETNAYFYFRASSTSYGQLVAQMELDHPRAEIAIESFLKTIDEKFERYRELEKYFREKDENGKTLWEDQNLQSKEYNAKRKELHRELFGSLEKIFQKEGLKYNKFYKESLITNIIDFIKRR